MFFFFFSSRRRHTRFDCDWSSDVCSSDLHKLGPAIAAGNAVVLKPAGETPISAIKLAEVFYDAGLPENWLQVVCGSGSDVGNAIVENDQIGAITFTGSAPVGWGIRSKAPHKKVNLELGSTAPLIVNEDG